VAAIVACQSGVHEGCGQIGGICEVRIVARKSSLSSLSSPCGEQMNQFITEGLKDAGL
jgi:hypothetical protein